MVVVSTVLLAFLGSGLNTHVAAGALICATMVALAAWVTTGPPTLPKARFWDWLMLIVFALVSLRAFLWLVYTRGDEICVLSPNNLGDLSLHLNLIRYLASGIAFWPDSSILSNAPLTYPLGSDLFNSVLEVLGIDTFVGLIWTGLAGAALTGYALWLWGGAFGLAAFLFNGGLTGFAVLRTLEIEDFQSEMVWKNLFLSMFVTQRGLLMALPSGLILLYAWRERYFRGSQTRYSGLVATSNLREPSSLQHSCFLISKSSPGGNICGSTGGGAVVESIGRWSSARAPRLCGTRSGPGDSLYPPGHGLLLHGWRDSVGSGVGGRRKPVGVDLEFWPRHCLFLWCSHLCFS